MWWRNHKNNIIIGINAAIALGLFGSFLASSTGVVSSLRPSEVLGETSQSTTVASYNNANLQATFDLINQQRQSVGLDNLTRDTELDAIAQARAADMQANVYYAHKGSDGRFFNDLMDQKALPYTFACENLNINDTYDSPYFVQSWLDSTAGHKECMLRSSHTKAGYAVAELPVKSGVALNQIVVVAVYSD